MNRQKLEITADGPIIAIANAKRRFPNDDACFLNGEPNELDDFLNQLLDKDAINTEK